MKLFWIKNRVLILTMAAVLTLGAMFWGGLHLMKESQMRDVLIRTAEAEAAVQAADVQQEGNGGSSVMPTPTPVPAESAEALYQQIVEQERRYRSIVPQIDNMVAYNYRKWKEGDPVDEALQDKARQEAINDFALIMGIDIPEEGITVTRYTDEGGYRENILRLTNEKQEFICVLTEKDLTLVAADTVLYSVKKVTPDPKDDGSEAAKILFAMVKGTPYVRNASSGRVKQETYIVALADGRYLSLAYTDNSLHGIKVHPNEYAMEEGVCFLGDIRMHDEVIKPWSEAMFEEGDLNAVQEGDMTPADAKNIYRMFLSAANGRAAERRELENKTLEEFDYELKEGEIIYYLDKSGQRENYYHIENQFVSMDIAAKSGYIVKASFSGLYNPKPELDLREIPYEHMGEKEYNDYVRNLVEMTFGKDSYTSIDVNAVADDVMCTMDVEMNDSSWYEFGFRSGRLMYLEYYAYPYSDMPGWVADSTYVNTLTGETFYMDF